MNRPTKKQRRIARARRARLIERTVERLSRPKPTWSSLAEDIADHLNTRMEQESFARRVLPIIHGEQNATHQQDAQ